MSNSAIPDLISEDIFRFGPGDRYALPIGTAAPDALALSQMAEKCRARHERLLVICADPLDAVRLGQEIPWFSPELGVRSLPDWETLPYDVLSPQEDIVSERLETLYRMTSGTKGLDVVIASAVTAAQRMAPVAYVGANTFFFRPGDTLSVEGLRSNLAAAGYAGVKQVLAAGEFAVRGSIIDVFPMGSDRPFRLDLFDDEIESIRWFDVETQRSMEAVNEIRLLPGHEFPVTPEAVTGFRQRWRTRFAGDPGKSLVYRDIGNGVLPPGIEYYLPLFFEQTATLADYLSAGTRVVLVGDVQTALAGFMKETLSRQRMLETDADRPAMKPEELWLTPEAFFTSLSKFARFTFRREGTPEDALALKGVAVDRKSQNPLSNLIAFTTTEKTRGRRTLIVATSVGRMGTMGELFRASGLEFTEYENWADFLAGDAPVGLAAAPLFAGSLLENPGTAILTETELYAASPRRSRLRRNRQSTNIEMIVRDVSELKIGDAVVHLEHGIGRYQGLVHMDTPDGEAELLHLYALRETRKGVVFPIDISDYEAFCEGFAFDETPDQAAAIGAVLNDMTTGKTMDRLVCGDVGFGKTEVALRAAFVAVSAGRQVAVLCPTTLLAEQHAQTFRDRFAPWPVRIAELSRFKTGKETTKALEGIADGTVDIVIGTHKLLTDKVSFKRLGLVIIDEEHRFGVRQKETLRKLRAEVDVLTLTATPIPRTLSMSLEGIRDFSVIATAPERRLAVKTFVHAEEPGLIREAVIRELKRGGQVYFLHNEVETIENRREQLAALIPEARIAVAHGQMSERELEHIMREFYQQRYNLLLCTTIIETGIDVPTANTIIMQRADKLGLAQLHQLRGRVGRSHHQAYAYLLTPPSGATTKQAKQRLEAIQSLEELGSGFYLAMHDLEIRGAGEVLGEHQSGEIAEVGFDLYSRMLANAVKALKRGELPDFTEPLVPTTEISLHAPALLPSSYVSDVSQRLGFYKELSSATSVEDIIRTTESLADRYGKLPEAAQRLTQIHRLRLRCEALGVRKIDCADTATVITFTARPAVEPMALIRFLQSRKDARMLGPDKLRIDSGGATPENRLALGQTVLAALEAH